MPKIHSLTQISLQAEHTRVKAALWPSLRSQAGSGDQCCEQHLWGLRFRRLRRLTASRQACASVGVAIGLLLIRECVRCGMLGSARLPAGG